MIMATIQKFYAKAKENMTKLFKSIRFSDNNNDDIFDHPFVIL
jgi:hypothetical protein